MPETVTIKGISQGILATSEAKAWDDLMPRLLDLIDQQAAFFKGAQLVLDVRATPCNAEQIRALLTRLESHSVNLVGILSTAEATRQAAESLQLYTSLADVPPPTHPTRPKDPDLEYEELAAFDSEEYGTGGVLIKRTLRSGRTVRSGGHVVVIGDVNSGAEIIAVGDVIIWGRLRGTVHAGAEGDETAVICALDLAPMQLRIANLITVPPKDKNRKPQPEMAYVADGQIEAAPWLA